jgi:hypothetical protein
MDKQLRSLLVKNHDLLKEIRAILITISAKLDHENGEPSITSYLNAVLQSNDVEKILREGAADSISKSVKRKYFNIGRGIIAEGFWKGHCDTVSVSAYGYPMGCLKFLTDGYADFQQFIDILKADYDYKDSRSRVASKLDDILREKKINLKTKTQLNIPNLEGLQSKN